MITLERNIEIRAFDVEATIAVGRERPEFLAIAQLASQWNRPLSGEDVTRELLGNLPKQVGWRVVDRCIALGLLEREGPRGPARLSEAGRAALETGQVLVPEEGTWRIYLADDPLLEPRLIHVQRFVSPDARHERQGLRSPSHSRQLDQGAEHKTPGPIGQAAQTGQVWSSYATGQPFQVRTVTGKGVFASKDKLQITVDWAPEASPELFLRGKLELPAGTGGKWCNIDRTLPPTAPLTSMSYDDLWKRLLAEGSGVRSNVIDHWCKYSGRLVLPVLFEQCVSDKERREMRREVAVPALSFDALGSFDASTLAGVEMIPINDEDAEDWLHWFQWDGVKDYAIPEQLRELGRLLRERFPHHAPQPLEPEDMLIKAVENPESAVARFLLAPSDLGLWRKP